jgi:hypothetical protein
VRVSRSPGFGGHSCRAVRPRPAAVDQSEEELKDDVTSILGPSLHYFLRP